MSKKPLTVKCPTCDKSVEWNSNNAFRPFCCERCKLIDLGEWASGERRIEGEPDWSQGLGESGDDGPSLH